MKFRRYILFFILILTFENAFAHGDFWTIRDFGNVKVRIITGDHYEEIEKVFLFGQLAEELAKQLNYSKPIFLDFNHYYIRNCEPDYFISYDKGNIQYYSYSWKSTVEDFLNDSAIVVRQIARQFDAQTTLKLLEYAILNIKNIKSSQTTIEYKKKQWIINSIDTSLIKKMLNEPNSIQINNILDLKVKRPEKDEYGISYYFQNNKYTVFFKKFGIDTTSIIITLDNVYDLTKINNHHSMVVFDTDSSFYFIGAYKEKVVSERHIIQNLNGYYQPFNIAYIGGDKLSIFFRYQDFPAKEKTFIYLIDEDKLIDIDELIHTK